MTQVEPTLDEPAWWIYRGNGQPHDGIRGLPEPPPWRQFGAPGGAIPRHIGRRPAAVLHPDSELLHLVNAAIFLRRPLLVSGQPGTGKSTLAYSIADELGLGDVLHWPITSRSSLVEGLYAYDAVGRLQESKLARPDDTHGTAGDVGSYVRLGPLGTALLPATRPRVLLIDEFDKSDVDLPNDLLNVFEEGTFTLRELERLPEDQSDVQVRTADPDKLATVHRGRITCDEFPIVIMTSNNEREFPPAFQRRCLHLRLEAPNPDQLAAIVEAHLGDVDEHVQNQIDKFLEATADGRDRAIDQILNLAYLTSLESWEDTPAHPVVARLLSPLGDEPG